MAAVGGCGVVLLALALLLSVPELLTWALAGLAAAYGLGLPVHAGSAVQAAGYGLGLFAVAELGYASFERITRVRGEPGTGRGRLVVLLGVVGATLAVDRVAIGSAGLPAGGDLLLATAVGGVVLLVATVAALVTRHRAD